MRGRRRAYDVLISTASGIFLAFALVIAATAASAQTKEIDIKPERRTFLMPKDCRYERDKAHCAADNRAIDFCRNEKDTNTVFMCLRANQSPLPCDERKSASGKQRCERVNNIYQPCKGKRGAELTACVDQRRVKDKRKK